MSSIHKKLQIKYPNFYYHRYHWEYDSSRLLCQFEYSLDQKITFTHHLSLPANSEPSPAIDPLVFHLGLVEMFNYWKATSSPNIYIQAGPLADAQLPFWQTLLKQGMGEFFYTNHLNPNLEITWHHNSGKPTPISSKGNNIPLIMLGGGKDSSATLGVFQQHQLPFATLQINPTPASIDINSISKPSDSLQVFRTLDLNIFKLNSKGYLNGHIPFSAVLSFIGSTVAYLNRYNTVIVSNEWSANEANLTYKDVQINHQYSKTSQYESDYRQYLSQFLLPDIDYFSFLRPLEEIRVAQLFAKYPQFHDSFLSCNRGAAENIWCGECPKCLFTFIMVSPFVSPEKLEQIFGKNLLNDSQLLETGIDLVDPDRVKPFECVGTREEVLVACYLTLKKYDVLPQILEYIRHHYLQSSQWAKRSEKLLSQFHDTNYLPDMYETALKKSLA